MNPVDYLADVCLFQPITAPAGMECVLMASTAAHSASGAAGSTGGAVATVSAASTIPLHRPITSRVTLHSSF